MNLDGITDKLTQRLGPLPVWGWGVVALGGVGAIMLTRRGNSAGADSGGFATAPRVSDIGGGGVGGGGGVPAPAPPAIIPNPLPPVTGPSQQLPSIVVMPPPLVQATQPPPNSQKVALPSTYHYYTGAPDQVYAPSRGYVADDFTPMATPQASWQAGIFTDQYGGRTAASSPEAAGWLDLFNASGGNVQQANAQYEAKYGTPIPVG